MKFWKHFKTITKHKWYVLDGCLRVGLVWQGLTHDLSKYSRIEFWTSARFYQGTRSPIFAERTEKGYSEVWMHHKGRNPHHFEYWTDWNPETGQYVPKPMPRRYLVESIMDRRAASMVYQGKEYRPDSALNYYLSHAESKLIHPKTQREMEYILRMLAEKGERETFAYIKTNVLTGKPFPWEENPLLAQAGSHFPSENKED